MTKFLPFLRFKAAIWASLWAIAPVPVLAQIVEPPSLLQFSSSAAASPKAPDFTGTGRPGRQTAGDSRDSCPMVSQRLTALMPTSHWGKTVTERPTFWFYVPYSAQQVPVGEFVLQDENRQDAYRVPFTLPQTPGFVSFTLPASAALRNEQWYRWYFKVYCHSDQNSSPIFVQGWIQKIASDPMLQSQLKSEALRDDVVYATQGIWYDAIAHLAELRLNNPQSTALAADWHQLLQAQGVDLLLPAAPLVGSVELD